MSKKIPYKILICDNHPIAIAGLTKLFDSEEGYDLVGVANYGTEVRLLLQKYNEVNTLLIDLKLPNTNIYRLIKDFVVIHSQVKIIVFTDYTLQKLVQDMMDFGVSAYLGKTASMDEILETIKKVHSGNNVISPSYYPNNEIPIDKISNLIKEYKDDFSKVAELTEREMDVIILMSRGKTNQEMATLLQLSVNNIETHRKNLMQKFKLKTDKQLTSFANQQGFI